MMLTEERRNELREKATKHHMYPWDVTILDLLNEIDRLKKRSPGQECLMNRAEGDGGCGACSVCCQELGDQVRTLQGLLKKVIDIAETQGGPEGDDFDVLKEAREAVKDYISPEFKALVAKYIEENKELLLRLAKGSGDV